MAEGSVADVEAVRKVGAMVAAEKAEVREVAAKVEVMMAVERAVKVEKPVADSGKWSHTPLRYR